MVLGTTAILEAGRRSLDSGGAKVCVRHTRKRCDILITAGGKRIVLDVMVTCPANRTKVTKQYMSQSVLGDAAACAIKWKKRKYLPTMPADTEFVPFVIETGGRLAKTTSQWLDGFWKDVADQKARKLRQASVRRMCIEIQRQMFFSNAYMLSQFAQHLTTTHPVQAAQ